MRELKWLLVVFAVIGLHACKNKSTNPNPPANTPTPTLTNNFTHTHTTSPTFTHTVTHTRTATLSHSPTFSHTLTMTPTQSLTSTHSLTPSDTPTPTLSLTSTPTPTPSRTYTKTHTPTATCGFSPIADLTSYIDNGTYSSAWVGSTNFTCADGSDNLFEFTLPVSRTLLISTCGSTNTQPILCVRSACGDPGTEWGSSTSAITCPGGRAELELALPAGHYYLIVDKYSITMAQPFQLTLTTSTAYTATPTPGAPICTITPVGTPVDESEPNDTLGQAQDLGVLNDTKNISADMVPYGSDVDWYKAQLASTWGYFHGFHLTGDCYTDGGDGSQMLVYLKNESGSTLTATTNAATGIDYLNVAGYPGQVFYLETYYPTRPYRLTVAPYATPTDCSAPAAAVTVDEGTDAGGTFATAKVLTTIGAGESQAIRGTVGLSTDDADYYRFAATATGGYSVHMDCYRRTGGTTPTYQLGVYDQNESLLNGDYGGGASKTLYISATAGQDFYIVVPTSGEVGPYRLTLFGPDP